MTAEKVNQFKNVDSNHRNLPLFSPSFGLNLINEKLNSSNISNFMANRNKIKIKIDLEKDEKIISLFEYKE